jgi:hypothetical protein
VEAVGIHVRTLMHVLDLYLKVGSSLSNGLHLYGVTGLHTINEVIAGSLICNRNLACGEGITLDCCDMIATIGDYGMAIITLGRLLHS